MSGDRDHLPSDRASRRLLKRGERRSGEPQALHAGRLRRSRLSGPDRDPGVARLAESRLRRRRHQAAARSAARSRSRRNTWRWSADMSLSGPADRPDPAARQQRHRYARLSARIWKTFDMAPEAAFAGRDAAAFLSAIRNSSTWAPGATAGPCAASRPRCRRSRARRSKQERGPRRRLNFAPTEDQANRLADRSSRKS